MTSSLSYGKVQEADQDRLDARRRTRRRVTIISLSAIVLIGVVVAAVLGTSLGSSAGKSKSGDPTPSSFSTAIKAVCQVTQYPGSCFSSLSSAANSTRLDPQGLFRLSLQVAADAILEASNHFEKLALEKVEDERSRAAISDCLQHFDLAVDHLNESLSSGDISAAEVVDDLKTWISAAGTYLETCTDGFENTTETNKAVAAELLKNSAEFTSNGLAILTGISNLVNSFKMRRLMSYTADSIEVFPVWASSKDRKLLQAWDPRRNADAVVAKDGSGKYKSINEALAAVPEKSKRRFVIYVKKGKYYESVRVEKNKWNVMIVGDGKDATLVLAAKNFVDGTPTFSTATFAVFGKGFVARDMGIFNTAGAAKHQAVALMASSDESIFYRCRFDAFQDTLYVHSLRQFYRECDIYGSVDFIFGNAAAVLQSCNIRPRVPMQGQQNTITAQGKVDPNQNTGLSIHNCNITAFGNLTSVRTYLGRPWKTYSTTIYMKSKLGSLIDSTGWMPWNATAPTDKLFYSEFHNYGPGSGTKNRVKWKGLKNISAKQAGKFTVKSFIQGDKWISKGGVYYNPSL